MNTLSTSTSSRLAATVPWWLLLLVAGLLIPGSGLIIGAVLGFTRFRHDRPALRWSFVLVGAALLAFQLVALRSGFSSHDVSPATRVS